MISTLISSHVSPITHSFCFQPTNLQHFFFTQPTFFISFLIFIKKSFLNTHLLVGEKHFFLKKSYCYANRLHCYIITLHPNLAAIPHLSFFGEMVGWSITPVLKTGLLRGTGGSNPSLSAKRFGNGCDNVHSRFLGFVSAVGWQGREIKQCPRRCGGLRGHCCVRICSCVFYWKAFSLRPLPPMARSFM